MRTVWILLLFGSLIAYHFLPSVSGEDVLSNEPKPSYDQCKPYVDEALKTGSSSSIHESVQVSPVAGTESASKKETEEGSDSIGADEIDSKEHEDSKETGQEEANEDDVSKEGDDDEVKEDGAANDENESTADEKESKEEESIEASPTKAESEESAEYEEKAEDDKTEDEESRAGDSGEPDATVSSDVANQADEPESEEKEQETKTKDTTEDASNTDSAGDVSSEQEEESKNLEENEQKSYEKTESAGDNLGESTESEESEEESTEDEVEQYIPRSRDHLTDILGLDDSEKTKKTFTLLDQATQITLKELKRIYENAIKPLEQTYKYRDLSNRHFGDPEIFSKPLIVFMGPWSGGKSTIINWLLDIQNEEGALRTGADPSPAQFNIMMYGKEQEVLDGTQLAADWTFSGLQKFGQSFLDRLRGRKLPNRLLEKVNIVEIPGILEVRKQVERSFPFNDACQWFIDRADVLFLVYDPAKLDIGPETEAILDQLKGRESQVRIILNKADTVTPDELLRVQAMLVWNISPLMSSAEPPIMYAASLWDRPLKPESPKTLLTAHENNFLKDIRDGIEKQVETRIAAARRFAVRVRNHAKMADCYLNTFHNHRSFFSDRKKISTDIIDQPQNYHIYEGLSTLTNISRYDLPDPDTYKDFFKLNNLWDFPTLASTCSYFRGCPINKLDIAIAYELPELLGKFRRQRESILTAQSQKPTATTVTKNK